MGMLLTCDNKGCGSQDYHKLEKDSGNVICVACGKPVNVTPYVKTVLSASGQIMRKPKAAMETQCPSCHSTEGPVLLKYNKLLYKVGCKKCKEVNAHLTKYFLGALRMKSDIEVIDMSQSEPVAEEEAISKTAEGAIIVNKPFTAPTKPTERKGPNPNPSAHKVASTLIDPLDEVEDDPIEGSEERPKIAVSKKKPSAASKAEKALRKKFVDAKTGDVSEALKSTLQINKPV